MKTVQVLAVTPDFLPTVGCGQEWAGAGVHGPPQQGTLTAVWAGARVHGPPQQGTLTAVTGPQEAPCHSAAPGPAEDAAAARGESLRLPPGLPTGQARSFCSGFVMRDARRDSMAAPGRAHIELNTGL